MAKIESIIIDEEHSISEYLRKCLHAKFPEITIRGEASNYSEACELIRSTHPSLVFSDVNIFRKDLISSLPEQRDCCYEMIYLSSNASDAINAIRHEACGFILKPLSLADIVDSVGLAIKKLSKKEVSTRDGLFATDHSLLPHTKLIGIPTMEGIEFLHVQEIVRCEGLQKCTRIITVREKNVLSSYNIGEFRKILSTHGFFSCHKSHLINLTYVRKLTKEGFIVLTDNSSIPLARRKRLEFHQNLKHL